MVISYKLEDNFAEAYSETKLVDLDIDKSKVIRALESMNVAGITVNPQNLAFELGVPKALLYQDLEMLQYIYKYQDTLVGVDKMISDLIDKLKFKNRHITRLKNQLTNLEKESENLFNDGFVQGAAINYQKSSPVSVNESWARGVLYIEADEPLSTMRIKSAYRALVTMLHPDQSARDSAAYLDTLKKAYDLLISIYT